MVGIRGYFTFEVILGEGKRKMFSKCGWSTRRRSPLWAIISSLGERM